MTLYKTYGLVINEVYNKALVGLSTHDLSKMCEQLGRRLHRHIEGDYYITWYRDPNDNIKFFLSISDETHTALINANSLHLFCEMALLAVCNFLMKNILY